MEPTSQMGQHHEVKLKKAELSKEVNADMPEYVKKELYSLDRMFDSMRGFDTFLNEIKK